MFLEKGLKGDNWKAADFIPTRSLIGSECGTFPINVCKKVYLFYEVK